VQQTARAERDRAQQDARAERSDLINQIDEIMEDRPAQLAGIGHAQDFPTLPEKSLALPFAKNPKPLRDNPLRKIPNDCKSL